MSDIKDLFNSKTSNKLLEASTQKEVGSSVESADYLKSNIEDKKRVIPHVDFASASNFAIFGSAEKYYEDAYNYVLNEYPYDGSLKEKINWSLSGTYLDRYIFENNYPRTTGYINFGNSYGAITQKTKGYDQAAKNEWIYFKGHNVGYSLNSNENPNLNLQFDNLNIYNTASQGLSNLELEGSGGVSVEFWLKKESFNSSNESRRQVVVDVWNSASWGTDGYGRFRVEISGTDGNVVNPNFHVELLSGTTGFSADSIAEASPTIILSGSTLTGSWNHFALTFENTGSQMVGRLYTNGSLTYTKQAGTTIGTVTGSMLGQVGSLIADVSGSTAIYRGYGKLSASLDEFRFWKTRRTGEQVGRHWFTQVAGGTNTDLTLAPSASTKYSYENPADLGVYYKFNEGIVNTSSIVSQDITVLDYAGRVTNGAWTGYTLTSRNTGSAIVSASAAPKEFADPILYATHPLVSNALNLKKEEGLFYDRVNNSSIYGSLPDWITAEDRNKSSGALKDLTQIMASYFDSLYLQTQTVTSLKDKDYISGSDKPFPFVNRFIDSSGFLTSEIYSKASDLEYLDARNDKKIFLDKVDELKNLIYQNIYNNLVYIYKTKGTEKSFRNLIRGFGVDDELINIRLYGNEVTHRVLDNYQSSVVKKKYVDFHGADRMDAVVFQQTASSNSYSRGYISSSAEVQYRGNTYEVESFFPKDKEKGTSVYFNASFPTASVYGCHTSGAAGSTAWGSPDYGQFQVQSVRPDFRRKAAFFQLTCSNDGAGVIPKLTSSVFQDVYDGTRWNFAVRVKPKKYPLAAGVSGSDVGQYDVEFSGYNYVLDVLNNSFLVTASVAAADAQNFLKANKRFFVGAHRTNTTGTVLQKSNVKASSLRVWMNYLTSSVLEAHAKDVTNFGSANPYRDAYITENGSSLGRKNVKSIPQLETLILNWDFDLLTGSNAAGNLTVQDTSIASSGSNDYTSRWGWLGPIGQYQHTGYGFGFPASDTGSIDQRYVQTLIAQPPEVINSSNMISLIDEDQNKLFTKDSRPEQYFFAFEKSMYNIITKEMIDVFGTIADFNNLIGEPVNRYRQEYKNMQKLRQLYFERVQNDLDLDKFVEYFKWLDSSISVMLQQLVPAGTRFSENLRTMVESHALERNKYWSKFPTLEMKQSVPEAGLFGINELLYPAKRGLAPIPTTATGSNCVWWHRRAERENSNITSGDATIDSQRNTFRRAEDFRSGSGPTLAVSRDSTDTTTTYEGQTYALRNFTKPYRLLVNRPKILKGGSNPPSAKKYDFIHAGIKSRSPLNSSGVRFRITASSISYEKECNDVIDPHHKERLEGAFVDTSDSDGTAEKSYNGGKSTMFAPFTLFSSSITPSYMVDVRANTQLANYHDDSYGEDYEIPIQGPFTDAHVGGWQYRHQNINSGATDTTLTRAEAWELEAENQRITISSRTHNSALPRGNMFRNTLAKRPLNIANLKWGTSSAVAGNYRLGYEILQTSGRSLNNRFFIANGGFSPTSSDTGIFSGAIDYALPRYDLTGTNKSIFIERFNAPGGPEVSSRGCMDVNAEEYSVYNQLNYRNLIVRTALDSWLTQHCGQFGISPTGSPGDGTTPSEHQTNPMSYDGVIAAYQKVNRNPVKIGILSGTSSTEVTTSINYDNWYIQHAIPQSTLQYAWIRESYDTTKTQPFGYAGGCHDAGGIVPFSVPSGATSTTASSVIFTTSSCWEPGAIDYVCWPSGGLNFAQYDFGVQAGASDPSIYKYTLTSSQNMLSPGSAFLNTEAGGVSIHGNIQNLNGPYGYPSWKQIRTGETPVARYHKRNNILSLTKPRNITLKSPNGQGPESYFNARADSFTNYVEPPVTFKHRPLISHLDANVDQSKPVSLKHTYGNNKCLWTQRGLPLNNTATASIGTFLGTPNEKKDKQMYEKLRTSPNYQASFSSLIYSEVIYPRAANTGLARTRARTQYAETAAQNTSVFPPTASLSLGSNGIDRGPLERRTFWRNADYNRNRYSAPIATSVGSPYARFQTTISNSCGNQDGHARSVWSFGEEPIVYAPPVSASGISSVAETRLSASSAIAANDGRDLGELNGVNFYKMFSFFGGITGSINPNSYAHQLCIAPSASAMYYHLPNFGNNRSATPEVYEQIVESFMKGMKWRTAIDAGKNPFYDSYEAFAENIRGLSQTHTVIPEFRISDNMEYYVKTAGGNFRAQNDKFLSLDGATITSSATNFSSSDGVADYNTKFFKEYSFSDFQKYFGKFSNNHQLNKITLKCNAVKKLLPYKGFYPSERSTQLVSLFSGALGPYITGGGLTGSNGIGVFNSASVDRVQSGSEQQALQSLLQPFFAPGILYNTIKSGIAVDWPVFTGSSDSPGTGRVIRNIPDTPGGAYYSSVGGLTKTVAAVSTRFPFKALLEPLSYIPVSGTTSNGDRLVYQAPSYLVQHLDAEPIRQPFASLQAGPTPVSVTDLYSSAMHNYLAEIPNFFLQNQELSSITSRPQGDITIEEGKTYIMDAYVEKTNTSASNELIMIQDYYNGYVSESIGGLGTSWAGTLGGATFKTGSWNGKYFGPKYDVYSTIVGAGTTPVWGNGAGAATTCDPAFAPCTPPYFYGKAKVRLTYIGTAEDAQTLGAGNGPNWRKILNNMTMSFKGDTDPRFKEWKKWNAGGGLPDSNMKASTSYQNAMDVTASLNIKGVMVENPSDASLNRWVISPHMETPVLDFSESQTPERGYGRGMWSGYGEIPKNNKGIFFGIQSAPNEFLDNQNVEDMTQWFSTTPADSFSNQTTTDARGRTRAASGPRYVGQSMNKKIGQIAAKKTISEAIVAIPFCTTKILKSSGMAATTHRTIMGKNFFSLNGNGKPQARALFNDIRANKLNTDFAIPEDKRNQYNVNKPISNTSVSTLAEAMDKYVFPPELDFNKYGDGPTAIQPFVMYVLEFEHELDEDELKDIWQGVMPEIATVPELATTAFSHEMKSYEFFGGKPLPPDNQVRWMIFKVKQRAAVNYYAQTKDSFDAPTNRDPAFMSLYSNPVGNLDYSYNWPYDNFSLVELAQVETVNSFNDDFPDRPALEAIAEGEGTVIEQGDPGAGTEPSRSTAASSNQSEGTAAAAGGAYGDQEAAIDPSGGRGG